MQKKDEKEEDESAPMDVDDEFKTAAPRPVQVIIFTTIFLSFSSPFPHSLLNIDLSCSI